MKNKSVIINNDLNISESELDRIIPFKGQHVEIYGLTAIKGEHNTKMTVLLGVNGIELELSARTVNPVLERELRSLNKLTQSKATSEAIEMILSLNDSKIDMFKATYIEENEYSENAVIDEPKKVVEAPVFITPEKFTENKKEFKQEQPEIFLNVPKSAKFSEIKEPEIIKQRGLTISLTTHPKKLKLKRKKK